MLNYGCLCSVLSINAIPSHFEAIPGTVFQNAFCRNFLAIFTPMHRPLRRLIFLMGLLNASLFSVAWGQTALGQDTSTDPSGKGYSFMAGGHWYGAHENSLSVSPSASLFAAVRKINRLQPKWIFALGDVVRNADDPQQIWAHQSLLDMITAEVILAAGNHDLMRNGFLNPALGVSHWHFYHAGDRFLILNTEELRLGGSKKLLTWLQDSLAVQPAGRNLFVFSHRLLWALAEPGLAEMDDFANEPFRTAVNADTARLVYEAVCRLAGEGPLHWFSGDVGTSWSFTVFEGQGAHHLRHFYAAGLGDRPEDAFWHVHVDAEGQVKADVFPLGLLEVDKMHHYDLPWWRKYIAAQQKNAGDTFGMRVKRFLGSKQLWVGVAMGILLVLGWRGLRRLFKI
jgi:hypothetical protein